MIVDKQKYLGQVFTPRYIVNMILDEIGYSGPNVLNKKIMEPSFGNGAFLIVIVQRFVDYCISINMKTSEIINNLESNICGIEIDIELFNESIKNLNELLLSYNITGVNWSFKNSDYLYCKDYDCFDYIVGNPPYIRVHNLNKKTLSILDSFNFSNGITDMYILFFELSIKMLNKNGKLGFISPNSFLKNKSQYKFREYLIENNLIERIIEFKESSIFSNVNTYPCISIINKNKQNRYLKYTQYNKNKLLYTTRELLPVKIESNFNEFEFNTTEDNSFLLNIDNRKLKLNEYCNVQYGISTNKDSVYINDIIEIPNNQKNVLFNNYEIEKDILQPIIKGSTFKGTLTSKRILFPYIWDFSKKVYVPMDETFLEQKYPLTYKYLLENKEHLCKRSMDKNALVWYQFGRNQGLNNINQKKVIINHILNKDIETLNFYEVSSDVIVYSGIFLTLKNEKDFNYIYNLLKSKELCRYCKLKGKDMSGGYKSISPKILKSYGIVKE